MHWTLILVVVMVAGAGAGALWFLAGRSDSEERLDGFDFDAAKRALDGGDLREASETKRFLG